jgi:L-seryl-tRNA(Ser) seleniumtransferase
MTTRTLSPDSPYRRLGVRPLINARGCATLAGGTLMDDEVLQAFTEAARSFVLISELQERAGRVIADITGAENGYVVSGAAAGLTLATAACIARFDVDVMNRLPDVTGVRAEVVVQRVHLNPYDHAVRAAGARLVAVDADVASMAAAIGPDTVAAFFHAQEERAGLSSAEFIEVAHRAGVPVIVDASMSLPPASNLRRFIAEGADVVAFSGGKTIRGPQGAGFIAGRADLLLSVALQHQDMDVLPDTWHARRLLADGVISRPPTHGIGRSMKVSKEEIAALTTALERYVARDHDAEAARWESVARRLVAALDGVGPMTVTFEPADASDRPIPFAVLRVDPSSPVDATTVVQRLLADDPRVLVNDYAVADGIIRLNPENLDVDDVEVICGAVERALRA